MKPVYFLWGTIFFSTSCNCISGIPSHCDFENCWFSMKYGIGSCCWTDRLDLSLFPCCLDLRSVRTLASFTTCTNSPPWLSNIITFVSIYFIWDVTVSLTPNPHTGRPVVSFTLLLIFDLYTLMEVYKVDRHKPTRGKQNVSKFMYVTS
jgi:hypothetical protein